MLIRCCIVSGTGKYDHVTLILKELKWLPVREYLYFRHAVMVYKCMTGNAPGYIAEKFQKRSDISFRRTRNSDMVKIPLYRTASGQRTFLYRAVSLLEFVVTHRNLHYF